MKFRDFSLLKDYNNLSTICDAWDYLAPKIYHNKQYFDTSKIGKISYSVVANVWSLGVVIYELLCPFLKYKGKYRTIGLFWCKKIIDKFNKDRKKDLTN